MRRLGSGLGFGRFSSGRQECLPHRVNSFTAGALFFFAALLVAFVDGVGHLDEVVVVVFAAGAAVGVRAVALGLVLALHGSDLAGEGLEAGEEAAVVVPEPRQRRGAVLEEVGGGARDGRVGGRGLVGVQVRGVGRDGGGLGH